VREEYDETFIGTGKAPVTLYTTAYVIKYSSETPLAALRGELADLVREQAAEARALGAGRRRGGALGAEALDGADAEFIPARPAHGRRGIDGRHQRRSSRVLVNICLAVCIAVTLAS
jgi:hypothetical protein